jgi:hypothetical protein
MKRFLITGLPRIRSAWLAALFSGDKVQCFHDAIHHGGVDRMLETIEQSTAPVVGLIDPGAASVYPRDALAVFGSSTIIMVFRNEEESRAGLARWFGKDLTHWDDLVKNHGWFMTQATKQFYAIDYVSLDDYAAVAEVYRICTGMTLDKHRFDLFNTLKIEQHYGKAAQAAAALLN